MNDERQVIVHCAETNWRYMQTTPAGDAGYPAVGALYQRIAGESLTMARRWVQDFDLQVAEGHSHEEVVPVAVPPHSPAVSAFWWGVFLWAKDFCSDMVTWWDDQGAAEPGVRQRQRKNEGIRDELSRVFVRPHLEFANWLRERHGRWEDDWSETSVPIVSPGQIILDHDARWILQVIKLTARWGLHRHLKDLLALWQALLLVRGLRRRTAVAYAYLESDVAFLQELFSHFPLTRRPRTMVDVFLAMAAEEVKDAILR